MAHLKKKFKSRLRLHDEKNVAQCIRPKFTRININITWVYHKLKIIFHNSTHFSSSLKDHFALFSQVQFLA